MSDDKGAAETAQALAELLEQVDAGQVEASHDERAYLAGALAALRRLAE